MSLLMITVNKEGIQFIWWKLQIQRRFRKCFYHDNLSKEDAETKKRCSLYSKQKCEKGGKINMCLCKLKDKVSDEVTAAQGSFQANIQKRRWTGPRAPPNCWNKLAPIGRMTIPLKSWGFPLAPFSVSPTTGIICKCSPMCSSNCSIPLEYKCYRDASLKAYRVCYYT